MPAVLRVALPLPLPTLFDYLPPALGEPCVGGRVLAPFGRGKLVGVVVAIEAEASVDRARLKQALRLLDDTALLDDELMRTLAWAADYWLGAPGEAYANALPLALRDRVHSGVHAVCNLSRSSIADARQNFPAVAVVLVTAPAEVIAARLAARGRESADLIRARLARRIDREDALGPDLIITNDGPVEAAIDRLVAYLRAELVDTAYPEAS